MIDVATFRGFMREVHRTLNTELSPWEHVLVGALGLAGEAGEVADLVKKATTRQVRDITQLTEEQRVQIAEELGDLLWYIALLVEVFGWSFTSLMQMNVRKLQQRFPNGWQEVEGH